MKCPRCGCEMVLDEHRKIPMFMCYDCGYIENRRIDDELSENPTNFERMSAMNINEATAFLAHGLGVDIVKTARWMAEEFKDSVKL